MRVFFGLQPDGDIAMQIAAWRDRQFPLADRPVPPANFHVTLAFLGEIKVPSLESLYHRVDEFCKRASPVGGSVTFDQTGYWQRPEIYWLGPTHWPESLTTLAGKLDSISTACGGKREHKRFQPHVTLFRSCRNAPPAPALPPVLTLTYSDFTLFESRQGRQGVRYHPLRYWELGTPD